VSKRITSFGIGVPEVIRGFVSYIRRTGYGERLAQLRAAVAPPLEREQRVHLIARVRSGEAAS
jgi:hypothetical protein